MINSTPALEPQKVLFSDLDCILLFLRPSYFFRFPHSRSRIVIMSSDGPRVGGGKKKREFDDDDDDEVEKKPAAKKPPVKKKSNAPEIDGWDCRNEDVMIRQEETPCKFEFQLTIT